MAAEVAAQQDFYPRPPRGGRHFAVDLPPQPGQFLSTPSARRATQTGGTTPPALEISIHALREEGDRNLLQGSQGFQISIHALREEGDTAARWASAP